ncbi:MAG: sensor histidine kinase [Planctomycetota bacterium]
MESEGISDAQQSELHALQRRLAKAERLAALGALTARMAHELGTPLHSIAGHLDLLLTETDVSDEIRERVEVIAGEVTRLETLIRSHLKRLRSPQPEPRQMDVNALVRRITRLMMPVFHARGVKLELDLASAASRPAPCDPDQLEQVLLNLVQNALDAMPDGGTLTVRTAAMDGGPAISVGDNGSGIEAEHLDRVFEPFFTTKATGKGTGLGLFLCQEIARKHGGDIVLDSEPGIGTVVTVTLGVEAGR